MEELTASQMEEELVSVIVPVYNAEAYLREALESLRSQTYTRFEAILVDDGSTDDSASICGKYAAKDNRFRLISQSNQGISAARNAGIEASTGKWITFLDSDDTLYDDAISRLLSSARRTRSEITIGKLENGTSIDSSNGSGREITLDPSRAIECSLYQKGMVNSVCGILFSRNLLDGENPIRFRKTRYEDLDFGYRVFEQAAAVTLLDHSVYLYRDNPRSFINTWSDSRFDVLDVTDKIVDHMRPGTKRLFKAALDRQFSAHYNILLLMLKNRVNQPGEIRRCLDIIRERRFGEIANPKVRLKNKLGAILSYGGMPMLRLLARLT